ncbi:MAG TPA: HAD family hydrolase [Candidatus Dojkabacteria bacterium]|nr:HAD family hydrolase [Candidatus Dojkabacteria bacterium]
MVEIIKKYKSSKYKGLMVDLDDTLITSNQVYDKAMKYTSSFVAQKFGLDKEAFYKLVQSKHEIIDHNFPTVHTRHSRILVYRMALDEMAINYDLGILPDIEDMYWEYFLNHVKVYPEVKDTLKKIRQAGVRIAIVSDGDLSLRIRKARKTGLTKLVDQIVASEEVIFEKPFSAIFTLTLSRLKLEPANCIMLGNNYKSDIRGAQLVGIRAGIFNPSTKSNLIGQDGTIVPDFTISRFSDILKELQIV